MSITITSHQTICFFTGQQPILVSLCLILNIIWVFNLIIVWTFYVWYENVCQFLSRSNIDGQYCSKDQENDRDYLHEDFSEVLFVARVSQILPNDFIWLQWRKDIKFTVAEEQLLDSWAIKEEDILKEL